MKKKIIVVLIGSALTILGLWGGAYFHNLWIEGWQAVPTVATAAIMAIIGLVLFIFGLFSIIEDLVI